jgi:hypothetical protein
MTVAAMCLLGRPSLAACVSYQWMTEKSRGGGVEEVKRIEK